MLFKYQKKIRLGIYIYIFFLLTKIVSNNCRLSLILVFCEKEREIVIDDDYIFPFLYCFLHICFTPYITEKISLFRSMDENTRKTLISVHFTHRFPQFQSFKTFFILGEDYAFVRIVISNAGGLRK